MMQVLSNIHANFGENDIFHFTIQSAAEVMNDQVFSNIIELEEKSSVEGILSPSILSIL